MFASRSSGLSMSLLYSCLALSGVLCGATTAGATETIKTGPIIIPIQPIPVGPTPSESSLNFGMVYPSEHYQQTIWFPISEAGNVTASIDNSHSGAVHITEMQAWWTAYGCSIGSSLPGCFDESIGGAGTLGVDVGESVGITVSIDSSFADPGSLNTYLYVYGSGGNWSENIPLTGTSATCAQGGAGSQLTNVGIRYNDITFDISSPTGITWGWKFVSGNLQSWGNAAPGGYVDPMAVLEGPPWTIMPATNYTIAYYPGGLGSACAPILRYFWTPPDPTSQCEADHDCSSGTGDDGTGGADGTSWTTLDPPDE